MSKAERKSFDDPACFDHSIPTPQRRFIRCFKKCRISAREHCATAIVTKECRIEEEFGAGAVLTR
jgi:hypothetical protein